MKKKILGTVDESVASLLYYDRKNDEDLPVNAIDKAIKDGEITVDEITLRFKKALMRGLSK